ncbi:NYN domain-containing protein [Geminocystis sp. NIES-3709]|uniref:NYN domain-containing protein n=1 Tax=Geminocystis sp. NIES-3709 TaxID=1617448 RepID=UPI0005FC51ED|nr:NYN domain-containing protein [Geminocystis sp. NIES-3709]BAQ66774.1 maebl [Geminocystis sp. NIES-3709]
MRGEIEFRSDKLAVLIDADNTSTKIMESLLREITKFGTAYVKRVYGDWTSPQMNTWKKILNEFALLPIQQFFYTSGKNSTDNALIIDAMDLLYTEKFDGFCIVSSDSDFTRLVNRIRQNGLLVYGFGKKTTPIPFVSACDRFICTDFLDNDNESSSEEIVENIAVNSEKNTTLKKEKKLNKLLKNAFDSVMVDESKTVNLGTLNQQLLKLDSSFDPRAYNYKKLGELLKSTGLFIVDGNNVSLK